MALVKVLRRLLPITGLEGGDMLAEFGRRRGLNRERIFNRATRASRFKNGKNPVNLRINFCAYLFSRRETIIEPKVTRSKWVISTEISKLVSRKGM